MRPQARLQEGEGPAPRRQILSPPRRTYPFQRSPLLPGLVAKLRTRILMRPLLLVVQALPTGPPQALLKTLERRTHQRPQEQPQLQAQQ
jgi:hypothetical protein